MLPFSLFGNIVQTHSCTVGTAIGSNFGLSILPKDTSTYGLDELGIEPPIFRLVDDLLYLVKHSCPTIGIVTIRRELGVPCLRSMKALCHGHSIDPYSVSLEYTGYGCAEKDN